MARSASLSSRRRFLKLAGAAGLSAAIASPAVALAQAAARSAKTAAGKPVPAAPDTSSVKPDAPSEFADDAKALAAVIHRRYGRHLDAAQLAAVTQDLDDGMQLGKSLRAAKLANGDEPETTFHA